MTNNELVLKALSYPFVHTIADIRKKTKLNIDTIKEILEELIENRQVYANSKKNLFYLMFEGTCDMKDGGYGFVKVSDSEVEYHISERDSLGALTGDLVEFYVLPAKDSRHLGDAKLIKILKHSNEYVFGMLCVKKNKNGTSYYISSHNKDFNIKSVVEENHLNGAIPGNIVVAKILDFSSTKKVYCDITKILGYKDDPGVEISLVAERYGFKKEFSDQTLEEIKSIPDSIDPKDFPNRKDYTNLPIITIDGKDSKDFDDAVYIERTDFGYKLIVCIADVSYYVREGSSLNADAYQRGTSVYLADKVIPMLPQKLSNGICSLNPNEFRLCDSVEMTFDNSGKLLNYELHEGIMKSHYRMTYEDVNEIFNGNKELIDKYSEIYQMLLNMLAASKAIRDLRHKKGAIDFDTPEYSVKLDSNGEPIEFTLRTRGDAEMMIEDFMLAANETVAYHLNISNLPCLYRVHEEPDEEKVLNVFNMINNLAGHKVRTPKNKILPKDVQKAMELVKEDSSFMAVNTLMLRAMKKARYCELNLGHYGLALQYYCHFTSPIRRYPDLVVHRILKQFIFHPESFKYNINDFERYVHEAGIDTSSREKKAIECEREVDDMLAAKYMTKHCGEEFSGVVSSITSFGMFVMLDNGIEGLVHITNMLGHYNLNENLMQLSSKNKSFKIGDKVNIVVTSVSVVDRKIDFILKEDYDKLGEMGYDQSYYRK